MCEQTVSKQQQKQEQTDQARTLIKSKLSKQTVKRRDGNQMQLPASTLPTSLPPSLSRYHSLCLPTHSAALTVRLCACRFVNKRVRTADCALSRSLSHCACSRSTQNFPNNYPSMRASLCVWTLCGLQASLSHTGFMNELTFVGQLSLSVRSFCLHLGFCPPLVAASCALCACSTHCCCCRSSNLKLNIDLNNILCVVARRLVLLSSIFSSSS